MANAAIICIGNELLNGHTIDTNSSWLAERLLAVSTEVVYSCCIGDDVGEIKSAIQHASNKADIILITGGLGPTDDDLTRNGFAEFLNTELVLHPELEEKIKDFFKTRGYDMPQRNICQAYLPKGTEEIENHLGTAPGILYQGNGKTIAALPGVPSEMKQMFESIVLPRIAKLTGNDFLVIKKLKCIGAGESTVAEMLGDMMERGRNPLINCTVDCGIITLHIISRGKDKKSAQALAQADTEKFRTILGDIIYSVDNETLAEVIGKKLSDAKKTLATAESCTGGLIGKMITDIPGCSAYFKGGWITYSNEAKISQLGVKKELIEKFGAVSSEVSAAMALGAKERSDADYAVSVTGIAGPQGESEQKPIGLVYISVAFSNKVETTKFLFGPGNRDFIRIRTAQNALNLLRLKFGV